MNKLTLYNDGFKIKLSNRRITVIKKTDESYWIKCVHLYSDKLTKKQLKHFDSYYQRGNKIVTTKIISLSTEAILCIAEGVHKFEQIINYTTQQP